MAKLRVIHNMVDTRCGITRRTGEVFEVNDEERIKELLNAKVVEEVKEKIKPDKQAITDCLFICPKTYDTKRWDGLTDLNWRIL